MNKVSPGLNCGFPLEIENAFELLNLINIQPLFIDNKLIFIIENPLVSDTIFNRYRFLPLPVGDVNNAYIFIEASVKLLSVSHTLNIRYLKIYIIVN